ncbi:hypothetical protein SUGI_0108110 [Cryptomeria japonica]|nr:hypothetical protein SUGI_0108110 [Cryptomeria japonica]
MSFRKSVGASLPANFLLHKNSCEYSHTRQPFLNMGFARELCLGRNLSEGIHTVWQIREAPNLNVEAVWVKESLSFYYKPGEAVNGTKQSNLAKKQRDTIHTREWEKPSTRPGQEERHSIGLPAHRAFILAKKVVHLGVHSFRCIEKKIT